GGMCSAVRVGARRGVFPPVAGRGRGISQLPAREAVMHTFAEYAPRGDAQVAGLVRDNPFAAVISTGPGGPVATHLPVIIPPAGRLAAGGVLWGHLARANPQWQTFEAAPPVLLIFPGAHADVSPAHHQPEAAGPRLN